jgi:hypothetical protein
MRGRTAEIRFFLTQAAEFFSSLGRRTESIQQRLEVPHECGLLTLFPGTRAELPLGKWNGFEPRHAFPRESGRRNQIRGQGFAGIDMGLSKRWLWPFSFLIRFQGSGSVYPERYHCTGCSAKHVSPPANTRSRPRSLTIEELQWVK